MVSGSLAGLAKHGPAALPTAGLPTAPPATPPALPCCLHLSTHSPPAAAAPCSTAATAGYWAFDGRKNMYAPFTELVPGDTLEAEARPPCACACTACTACPAPLCVRPHLQPAKRPRASQRWHAVAGSEGALAEPLAPPTPHPAMPCATPCLLQLACLAPSSHPPTYPSLPCYSPHPTHPPPAAAPQVSVELEGEGRPRRLSVVIRRVDIIPIASLQSFMVSTRCAVSRPQPGALPTAWRGDGGGPCRGAPLRSCLPAYTTCPPTCPPAGITTCLPARMPACRPPVPQKGQDEELAYHAIQALDVVLKHRASYNRDCLPVGRAFFFHDDQVGGRGCGVRRPGGASMPACLLGWAVASRLTHGCMLAPVQAWPGVPHGPPWPVQVRSIGGGAEVWLGYQQSLRPCQVGGCLPGCRGCQATAAPPLRIPAREHALPVAPS